VGLSGINTPSEKGKAVNDDDDFSLLDDPAVIAERARVRGLLGPGPPEQADPALLDRYQRITEEFDRRASAAWSGGSRSDPAEGGQ
jgi:hypothetical protein